MAQTVGEILSRADEELDYAEAQIAFDRIVDPDVDGDSLAAELDRMAEAASRMAGPSASDREKLNALRTLIYESGPWNGHRPFSYDHEGFKALRCKLLSNYLKTRLGNCVSMPVLFLILGDRLGLNVRLGMAPQHLFIRYREGEGPTINLETTGTALPSRDIWYRQIMPMSDRAVASGLYLRTCSKRESVAALANTVLEFLSEKHRFNELVTACTIVLRHSPRDGNTWARQSHACYTMICDEYLDKYPSPSLIPPHLRPRYSHLARGDMQAFRMTHALGWQPPAHMAAFYERFEGLIDE